MSRSPRAPRFLRSRPRSWRRWFRHAFAVEDGACEWTAEDEALIERVAAWVVSRGLASPTAFLLETYRPFGFLGSQMLVMAEPFVELACQAFPGLARHLNEKDHARFVRLLERRDAIERLLARIEEAGRARNPD
jgi:hypothetical protein